MMIRVIVVGDDTKRDLLGVGIWEDNYGADTTYVAYPSNMYELVDPKRIIKASQKENTLLKKSTMIFRREFPPLVGAQNNKVSISN